MGARTFTIVALEPHDQRYAEASTTEASQRSAIVVGVQVRLVMRLGRLESSRLGHSVSFHAGRSHAIRTGDPRQILISCLDWQSEDRSKAPRTDALELHRRELEGGMLQDARISVEAGTPCR